MALPTRTPVDAASPLKGPVLTAKQLADILSISTRTVWRFDSAGFMPKPIRLGKTVRWKAEEVTAWIEAGCPVRSVWDASRRIGKGVR